MTNESPRPLTPVELASLAFDKEAYAAAIGPNNTAFYLKKFEVFHLGDKSLTWNWPASLVTFYWLVRRKMWMWMIVYCVAPYIAAYLLASIAAIFGFPAIATTVVVILVFYLVPGFMGNRAYYRRCRRLVNRSRETYPVRSEQLDYLRNAGGSGTWPLVIAMILSIIGVAGIVGAIVLPAYQTLVLQSRVNSAYANMRMASHAIEQHSLVKGKIPASLAEAGISDVASDGTQLAFDSGTVTLIASFQYLPGKDGTIVFKPAKASNGTITWVCNSPDIDPGLMPEDCR